jgi:hypothetical protein
MEGMESSPMPSEQGRYWTADGRQFKSSRRDQFRIYIVRSVLGVLQQLCLILRGERFCFGFELRLSGLVEFWRRSRPSCNCYAYLRKELFLPGRRADAQETCRSVALVVKLVRRVGRNMNGLAGICNGLYSSKCSLDLAFENDEGLLKVVPSRGSQPMAIRTRTRRVTFH